MQGTRYCGYNNTNSSNRFDDYFYSNTNSINSSNQCLNEYTAIYPSHLPSRMATTSIEEHESKIVEEFTFLLDKSRQLFNGLR